MKRRALLTTVGAGVTGLAGCLGLGGGGGGDSSGSDSTPSTATFTPISGSPDMSLERINASGQTEIGQAYSFEIEVTNRGDRPGIYRAPINIRAQGDLEFETVDTAQVFVEPGETQTATISLPPFDFAGQANIRFESSRNEWTVQVVGPDLTFGQSFDTRTGVRITVQRVALQDSYSYVSAGEEQTAEAPEGSQWAFVYLRIEATGGQSYSPPPEAFRIQANGVDYRPAFITRQEGKYLQQTVSQGGPLEGWIGYEVPASLSLQNVSVKWEPGNDANITATWYPREGTAGGNSGSSDS